MGKGREGQEAAYCESHEDEGSRQPYLEEKGESGTENDVDTQQGSSPKFDFSFSGLDQGDREHPEFSTKWESPRILEEASTTVNQKGINRIGSFWKLLVIYSVCLLSSQKVKLTS